MAEALEKSSPATMALAKRNGSSLMSKMATSSLKTTSTATDSLNAMLGMAQHTPEPKVTMEEEEDFGFPSIEWLSDDADTPSVSFPSMGWLSDDADTPSVSPISLLNDALDIVKDFQRFPKPAAKRRRMGEPQGMVRSKALKSELSSLVTSCSQETTQPVNTNTTKFVLGAWGSMVTARDVTKNLATCSLKCSPFVHTPAVNTGLLLTV